MKKSELRRIVASYKELKIKFQKTPSNNLMKKLKEIEHRYFHETGRSIEWEFKQVK